MALSANWLLNRQPIRRLSMGRLSTGATAWRPYRAKRASHQWVWSRAGSGPPGEKAQDALLEYLVSDRGHMVAPGYLARRAGRQQGRQFRGRAPDRILAADRDQRRDPDAGDLGTRERLARPAHAGRERPQVGFGLLGKNPE